MIRSSGTAQRNEPTWNRPLTWERMGVFYARVALGCAFLSAVADRFGLWGKYGGWGEFSLFTRHRAPTESLLPWVIISFLASAAPATVHLVCCGVAGGRRPLWVVVAAATMLLFLCAATC